MKKQHEGVQGIGNEIEPSATPWQATIPDVRPFIKSEPVIAGAAAKILAKKKMGLETTSEADSGLSQHRWRLHGAAVLAVLAALEGRGEVK